MSEYNKKIKVWIPVISLLLFIAVVFTIGAKFTENHLFCFAFLNVATISYSLLGVLTIISLRKHFNILSILIIISNSSLSFGQLYFLDLKLYHIILIVLLIFSLVYFTVYLINFLIYKKNDPESDNIKLVNCILPVAFVGATVFVKAFHLFDLIETKRNNLFVPILCVSLLASVIALIIAIILIKERQDAKEYFGKLAAVFFITFVLFFTMPLISSEYANYVFDTSAAEKKECVVIDKHESHGGKGATRYYLVIQVDGQKIEFCTNKAVYSQYDIKNIIYLYEYEGAFDRRYYEYQDKNIYQYYNKE